MKPTSLIFLAFSIVLIIGGLFTCRIAENMSAKQGIRLYDQEYDNNGDLVYVYNISDSETTKISLNFDSVDVNVIASDKSYIEIKNFKANGISTSKTGGAVSIDGTSGFINSLIDMSSGGIQFKGLRYFLLDDPSPDSVKSVNVYLSDMSELQKLSINVKNANISVNNINNEISYSLNTDKGNIIFEGISNNSIAELSATSGNVTIDNCKVMTVTSTVKRGSLFYTTGKNVTEDMISYNITANDGNIIIDGSELEETKYIVTSPIAKASIKATVNEGTAVINNGTKPSSEVTD